LNNNYFKHAIIISFCSLTLLTSQILSATSNLPDLGSTADNILSPSLAKKIGAAYIRQARSQMNFIDDPLLLHYLNELGNKLVVAATANQTEKQEFTFHLVDDSTINAFAVPGGHIVIHSGLIINSKNEQQLAATLAHEIAHITQNHSARSIENSRYNSAIAIASLLLAAASQSAEAAQAAIIATQGSIIQKQLSYSRDFEREADNNAVRTLYKAGFNPGALTEFLQILNKKQNLSGANPPEFLLTHPLTNQRISETDQRARAYPKKEIDPQEELAFKDFQALIEAEYHTKPTAIVKHYQFNTGKLSSSDHFKYGLALIKTNKLNQAEKHLQRALKQHPENLSYQVGITELEIARKNHFKADQIFKKIKSDYPESYPMVAIYHANTLITSKHNEQALSILKVAAANNPNEPLIRILLARAYGELELLANSYVERAQYHYLRGSYDFAIKQLENALPYTSNSYQKRKIESKKESFQNEKLETEAALKKLR
jgi:predicted Zn-dependent protease